MPDPTSQRLRDENAAEFMGAGFARDLRLDERRRRAYLFWYHPLVELAIFVLVLISIALLIIEIAITDGRSAGWLTALATKPHATFFFWSDVVITAILAAEYGSKLWITPKGRRLFFIRHTWIELLSLLPLLRVFRLFRIFRTVRLFRLMRILRTLRLIRASRLVSRFFGSVSDGFRRQRGANAIIITYFLATMLFGTLGIIIFEQGAGSGIETFSDALWWAVVTLSTVGYGDLVPATQGGRIIAGIVMVLGLGFWSIMIGVFTTSLVERARQKETMGLDILGVHDHIILLGWNPNAPRLIADLRDTVPQRHLVVICDRDDLDLRIDARLHHLRVPSDDPTKLELAQYESASAIVLLASDTHDQSPADIDAHTLLQALKLRRIYPQIHLVTELMDDARAPYARDLGIDDVIVTRRHGGSLLAQTLDTPDLQSAFTDLFDVAAGPRFSLLPADEAWLGRPLAQILEEVYTQTQSIPFALLRDNRVLLAPDDPITAGDQLLLIEPSSDTLEAVR